jgi:hypothetical protein
MMTDAPIPVTLPPKLAELFEAIEAVRAETLGLLRDAADGGAPSLPAGAWTAPELIEHLLLSEISAGKVVRKVLRDSGASLPPYPSDDSGLRIRQPVSFDGMEAPPVARPTGAPTRETLMSQAADVRAATLETMRMLSAVDPTAGAFPHHRFGSLNLYEWLAVVILEHEKAHRPQLQAAIAGGRP